MGFSTLSTGISRLSLPKSLPRPLRRKMHVTFNNAVLMVPSAIGAWAAMEEAGQPVVKTSVP